MEIKSTEEEWKELAAALFGNNPNRRAGDTQYDDMRQAFFCGAFSLFIRLNAITKIPTDQVADLLIQSLSAELFEFMDEIYRKAIERN